MLYKVTLFLLIFGSIASEAEDNQDLKNDILFLKIQELEAEIAELRNKVESQNFLIEKLISESLGNSESDSDDDIENLALNADIRFKGIEDPKSKDQVYNVAIEALEIQDFEKAFQMHVVCNQILSQAVIDSMKKAYYGRVVNVISTSVKVPINGLGVSNTIRGAVASWAKTMANELGQYGITVNNVLPGFTNTNRLKTLISKKAQVQKVSEEHVANGMLSTVPASRFGEAKEVANTASSFVIRLLSLSVSLAFA